MPGLSFTPGDAMFVAHQSVVKTTGSGEPAVPTATLDMYNVNTNQQLQAIRNRIRNDSDFGLPSFKRSIDPNALKDIATDTVLQDLADLVFFQSFEVVS
jgi:phage gp37-like protein